MADAATAVCLSCDRSFPLEEFISLSDRRIRRRCRPCRRRDPYPRDRTHSPDAGQDSRLTHSQDLAEIEESAPIKQEEGEHDYIDLTQESETDSSLLAEESGPSLPISASDARAVTTIPTAAHSGDSDIRICHPCPITGLCLSGRYDDTWSFVENTRWFVLPRGIQRSDQKGFPSLDAVLEDGMVERKPGCFECDGKGIHCTYSAGIELDGGRRDVVKGKCDFCKLTNRKCRDKDSGADDVVLAGAYAKLMQSIDQFNAQLLAFIQAQTFQSRSRADKVALLDKFGGLARTICVVVENLSSTAPQATSPTAPVSEARTQQVSSSSPAGPVVGPHAQQSSEV